MNMRAPRDIRRTAGHQPNPIFERDRVLILGERHLALVVREYLIHYNQHRPHQSRQQRPPDIQAQPARDVADLRSVRRKPGVAGVLNEYHHAA